MIVFYLEDRTYRLNLERAGLKTQGGDPAIKTPPMYDAMYFANRGRTLKNKIVTTTVKPVGRKYIIPVGVGHSPEDWAKEELFDAIAPYADDMKAGFAFLMLDQSHEGHHASWLFQWFHNICDLYSIPISQIIYVTGDLKVTEKYDAWTKKHGYTAKMKTIPYVHFEQFIFQQMEDFGTVSFSEHVVYKERQLSSIFAYNCLQKRPRGHRVYLFDRLEQEGLLPLGINSMNAIDLETNYANLTPERGQELNANLPLLPMNFRDDGDVFAGDCCGHFIGELNISIMLQSFLTVVSEASHFSSTCFISEKTFKPIAGRHPFIIFGNPGILKKLRGMGYRTFDGLIDERYDKEDDLLDRIDRIVHFLKEFSAMPVAEQFKWFKETREICEYNHQVLVDNCVDNQSKRFAQFTKHIKRS